VFLWVSLQRIRYPLDLEWMESGMMCHALRLLLGQGIYVPPSVDFIPHLYTPLYPALLALLGKLTGDVSYLAARLVSLLSFLGALGLGGCTGCGGKAARWWWRCWQWRFRRRRLPRRAGFLIWRGRTRCSCS
jgi:hypothetical protein